MNQQRKNAKRMATKVAAGTLAATLTFGNIAGVATPVYASETLELENVNVEETLEVVEIVATDAIEAVATIDATVVEQEVLDIINSVSVEKQTEVLETEISDTKATQDAANQAAENVSGIEDEMDNIFEEADNALADAEKEVAEADEATDKALTDIENATTKEEAEDILAGAEKEVTEATDAANNAKEEAAGALSEYEAALKAYEEALKAAEEAQAKADAAIAGTGANADELAEEATKKSDAADALKAELDKAAQAASDFMTEKQKDLATAQKELGDAKKALEDLEATTEKEAEEIKTALEATAKTGAFVLAAEAYEAASELSVKALEAAVAGMEEAKELADKALAEAEAALNSATGNREEAQDAYDAAVEAYKGACETLDKANADLETAKAEKEAADTLANTVYGQTITGIEKDILDINNNAALTEDEKAQKLEESKDKLFAAVIAEQCKASVTGEINPDGKNFYVAVDGENKEHYYGVEANGDGTYSVYEWKQNTEPTDVKETAILDSLPTDKEEWEYRATQREDGKYYVEYLNVANVKEEKVTVATGLTTEEEANSYKENDKYAVVTPVTENVDVNETVGGAKAVEYAKGDGTYTFTTSVDGKEIELIAGDVEVLGVTVYGFYYNETVSIPVTEWKFTGEYRTETIKIGSFEKTFKYEIWDYVVTGYKEEVYRRVVSDNITVNGTKPVTTYTVTTTEHTAEYTYIDKVVSYTQADKVGSYENITNKVETATKNHTDAETAVTTATNAKADAEKAEASTKESLTAAEKELADQQAAFDTVDKYYDLVFGNEEGSVDLTETVLPDVVVNYLKGLDESKIDVVVDTLEKWGVLDSLNIEAEEIKFTVSEDGTLSWEIPNTSKYDQAMLTVTLAKAAAEANLKAATQKVEDCKADHADALKDLEDATKDFEKAAEELAKAAIEAGEKAIVVEGREIDLTIATKAHEAAQKLAEKAEEKAEKAEAAEQKVKDAQAKVDALEAEAKTNAGKLAAAKLALEAAKVKAEAAKKNAEKVAEKALAAQEKYEAALEVVENKFKETEDNTGSDDSTTEDNTGSGSESGSGTPEQGGNGENVTPEEVPVQPDTPEIPTPSLPSRPVYFPSFDFEFGTEESTTIEDEETPLTGGFTTIATADAVKGTLKDGKFYDANGKVIESAIVNVNGTLYAVDEAGSLVRMGFVIAEDTYTMYFADKDGKIATRTFIVEDGDSYLLISKAKVGKNGVGVENHVTYYAGKAGNIIVDRKATIGEFKYTFDADGVITKKVKAN